MRYFLSEDEETPGEEQGKKKAQKTSRKKSSESGAWFGKLLLSSHLENRRKH